jgi:hypothetical protein
MKPAIDGLSVDEFIAGNADPIWLCQNELWELMPSFGESEGSEEFGPPSSLDEESEERW